MSSNAPDWLAPPRHQSNPPDWLSPPPLPPAPPSPETRALMLQQFEVVFPRVLDMVAAGWTYGRALKELRVEPPIDVGLFIRWLKKRPALYELYKEAKEIRTEEWASRIISHAEASEQGFENDVARSGLIINTYKFLMSADNRKQYGESKQIEVNQNISITAALEKANSRVEVIEAEWAEVDQMLLTEGDDE